MVAIPIGERQIEVVDNQRKVAQALIDTQGKYLTRAGEVVDIVRVDRTTAVGRLAGVPEALVWDINTGDALGHSLENSLVGKHRNLPAVALQVAQLLGSLDSNQQRLQVINILHLQVCLDCGSVLEPGVQCPCKTPKTANRRSKAKPKTVH
jgi:hypothetical protein